MAIHFQDVLFGFGGFHARGHTDSKAENLTVEQCAATVVCLKKTYSE
jgi:hypothetical protein